MAVDEPRDVLEELVSIAARYTGPKPWVAKEGSPRSNPIKLGNHSMKSVTAHPDARNDLSARSGSALLYALKAQGLPLISGQRFNREFPHKDGRSLHLENGVLRDLIATGAVSGGNLADSLLLTGLGAERLVEYF